MRRTTLPLILTTFSFIAATAQTPAPRTFDVASVKPSPRDGSDLINIRLGSFNHGVISLENTTLSECIRYAYGLVGEDQINGPDWIRDRTLRVDITAKTSPDTPLDQALLMLQALLAERFHLQFHREPKPLRHFELAIAKNGTKLHQSPEDAQTVRKYYGSGRLFYDHLPMNTFAVLLSRQLKQPVIDLTGLKGFYDVHLEWTPDDAAPKETPKEINDTAPPPDIFHAMQDQLGLQLEPSKAPLDILIVDHADKVPIAN